MPRAVEVAELSALPIGTTAAEARAAGVMVGAEIPDHAVLSGWIPARGVRVERDAHDRTRFHMTASASAIWRWSGVARAPGPNRDDIQPELDPKGALEEARAIARETWDLIDLGHAPSMNEVQRLCELVKGMKP